MRVDCIHARPGKFSILCGLGLFGGRPSPGICEGCESRTPGPRAPRPVAARVIRSRPAPTLSQALTLGQAMMTARRVPLDVLEERVDICGRCERQAIDPRDNAPWCTLCGCPVSKDRNKVQNLARVEENLPKWGCKHPLRGQGRGWRR